MNIGQARQAEPIQRDIWVLVLFEAITFSGYFLVYMYFRAQNAELFLQSQQQLNAGLGFANTLLLLLSSWFMARCVQASRERRYAQASRLVYLTIACGALFVCGKLYEWTTKIRAGIELSTNEFYSYYYFLTGIHVLHVLIGFVFLGVVAWQLHGPQRRNHQIVDDTGIYWHMVDFLWVIIFALLYVMR
ncbi:cytochrome c oxidase subunit 3 family protein [Hydrocarboniphaga sp.]|uniref:cytochrome c oxidase subunit 3 family protein n=1 Tax=Hydrocarboniphaga sp. TaxID=2033016 RepID=UPI003D096E79